MLEAVDGSSSISAPPQAAYDVERIDADDDFFALEAEWNGLVEGAGMDHPFARHEWLATWWRCFGADNRLDIVTARRDGRLVGVAPLMRNVTRMYGLKARRLQSIWNVHTPRLDLIVAGGHEDACSAIWRHIAARDDWDVLELNQLPEGSATLETIAELADREGLAHDRWASGQAPYVPIDGDWDDYYESLATKHRSNLRNRTKRLRKIGELELQTITRPGDDLDEALRDGLRIEAAGWKGEEGSAIRCEDDVHAFYRRYAAAAAEHGRLYLQFLAVDGTRIAFAYSVRHANRLFLLKTGYDPEYSKYSPFNVLLREMLHHCWVHGLEEFDFLGVFDSWKERWARRGRDHYWLYVFSGSPTARLIHAAKFGVAPRVKQLLGSFDDGAEED